MTDSNAPTTNATATATATTTTPTHSVFVGNLPRSINKDSLLEFFNKDGKVKVESVKIIRPPNGRVFGFLNVASDADAKKAIDLFQDQELQGRKISVQASTPSTAPKTERKPREPRTSTTTPAATGGAATSGAATGAAGGEKKPRRERKSKTDSNKNGTNNAVASTDAKPKRERKPKPSTENGATGATAGGATAANADGDDKKRRTRPQKAPRADGDKPAKPREPIDPTITLFVANLPFTVDEEALKVIMKGPSGTVTSARIIRSNFNNRSKGFGFVSYDSTQTRDAALTANNSKEVEGRKLSVSLAKEDPKETGNATQ